MELKQNSFYKSLLQLLSGSLIAQVITIVVSFIITRIYSVEEIAYYSIILTFVSLFGPVLCAKLDSAIVVANTEDDAAKLTWGSLYLAIIFVILSCTFYIIYINYINEYSYLFKFTLLLGILLLLHAIINVLTSINNRYNEYALISNLQIKRSLIQNTGIVIFGLMNFGTSGLIVAQHISLIFGVRTQLKSVKRIEYRNMYRLKEIVTVIKKYKEMYLFTLPAHFINSASYSLLNLFIMSLFGTITFGYYSMTFRILSLPLTLISMNVSRIFVRRASELHSSGDSFFSLFRKVSILLICVAVPMVLILILFAPSLFSILLGESWRVAGEYARVLAPMYGIRLVVSALTPVLLIVKKQKIELLIQVLFLLTAAMTYWIVDLYNLSVMNYLFIISIVYSIIYIGFYIVLYSKSK